MKIISTKLTNPFKLGEVNYKSITIRSTLYIFEIDSHM